MSVPVYLEIVAQAAEPDVEGTRISLMVRHFGVDLNTVKEAIAWSRWPAGFGRCVGVLQVFAEKTRGCGFWACLGHCSACQPGLRPWAPL